MKAQSASQKRYARLTKLVKTCMEHFSEDDMLEVFEKQTGKEYMESKDHEEMVSELVMAGYCIFKPDSSDKSDKLKEYAETVIFPYYNEQMTAILF
jgi:hypothetical protein